MSQTSPNIRTVVTTRLPSPPKCLSPNNLSFNNETFREIDRYYMDGMAAVNYAGHIIMKHRSNDLDPTYIPLTTEAVLAESLGALEEADIVVLVGDVAAIGDLATFKDSVWNKYGKAVIDEADLPLWQTNPAQMFEFFIRNKPRRELAPRIDDGRLESQSRYEQLVALMNADLSINEIAQRLNVTRSAVYLMRSQYKDQLKLDVDRGMRAMQFRKRED